MVDRAAPVVSIGVPVYNSERFLSLTLDSLLTQTFTDFELIISDNASVDRTQAICQQYAHRDARIRYIRQPVNRGAVFNWNFVVQEAKGKFFKWASANDLCVPEFLARCVKALEEDPSLVLVYGRSAIIDDSGTHQSDYELDPEALAPRPSARFVQIVDHLQLNNAQSGLIRRSVLQRTRGERGYQAGDMVLMAELALYGGYKLLPERLLLRRMDKQSTTQFMNRQELQYFLRPQGGGMGMPNWRKHIDYAWSVLRAPISLREKVFALGAVLRRAIWNRGDLACELMAVLRTPSR